VGVEEGAEVEVEDTVELVELGLDPEQESKSATSLKSSAEVPLLTPYFDPVAEVTFAVAA
jgi:hypothetical protein